MPAAGHLLAGIRMFRPCRKAAMVSNAQLLRHLMIIEEKLDVIMSQQDSIDADVTAISAALGDVATQTSAIAATQQQIADEIAALKAGNPALDLSALDQLAATAGQQASARR